MTRTSTARPIITRWCARPRKVTDSGYDNNDEGVGGSAGQRQMALTAEDRYADDTMLWFVFENNYEKKCYSSWCVPVLPLASSALALHSYAARGWWSPVYSAVYIKILCLCLIAEYRACVGGSYFSII